MIYSGCAAPHLSQNFAVDGITVLQFLHSRVSIPDGGVLSQMGHLPDISTTYTFLPFLVNSSTVHFIAGFVLSVITANDCAFQNDSCSSMITPQFLFDQM